MTRRWSGPKRETLTKGSVRAPVRTSSPRKVGTVVDQRGCRIEMGHHKIQVIVKSVVCRVPIGKSKSSSEYFMEVLH